MGPDALERAASASADPTRGPSRGVIGLRTPEQKELQLYLLVHLSKTHLIIDITPLRKNKHYRALFLGQFISSLGSMMSTVAVPYILFSTTKSTTLLGMMGIIQLIPSIVGGLIGGTLADAVDRKRLILACELGMALVTGGLAVAIQWSAPAPPPASWIFAAAASIAIFNGFHRPALEALTPRLISREEIPAAGVLQSLRGNISMIGGPAAAGVLIAWHGPLAVLWIDFATFVICIAAVLTLPAIRISSGRASFSIDSIRAGFKYAASRQDLIGTYLIDIIAMTFSMPHLLFPAVADAFGSAVHLGSLHSALAIGALLATLGSRWMLKWKRHGLVITRAAACWSLAMIGFGLAPSIEVALFFLLAAGFADMISAVFRMTIWNQTIPDEYRGRLAGIEMISYLSGPMMGNAQLGLLAAYLGVRNAISISSSVGVIGVLLCGALLPKFIQYEATPRN